MISTPVCPSSWKARIRWSGIARPTWMSGEVTSMPSFTRSGPAERQLPLELALGQHVDGVPGQLGEAHPPSLEGAGLESLGSGR